MFNRNRNGNGKGKVKNATALKERITDSLKYTEEQAENIRAYIKSIELEKKHKTELLVGTVGLLGFAAGVFYYLHNKK